MYNPDNRNQSAPHDSLLGFLNQLHSGKCEKSATFRRRRPVFALVVVKQLPETSNLVRSTLLPHSFRLLLVFHSWCVYHAVACAPNPDQFLTQPGVVQLQSRRLFFREAVAQNAEREPVSQKVRVLDELSSPSICVE